MTALTRRATTRRAHKQRRATRRLGRDGATRAAVFTSMFGRNWTQVVEAITKEQT